MGKTTGFIDYTRKTSTDVPPLERIETLTNFMSGSPARSSRRRQHAAWTAVFPSVRPA